MQTFRRIAWFAMCLIAALATFSNSDAAAQDRVTLQPSNSPGRITVTGIISEYTGLRISVRATPQAPLKHYPAEQVVGIETEQTAPHVQGLQRLGQGRPAEAIPLLEQAMREETRAWVKREILASLVKAALRRSDVATAGSYFVQLMASDSTSRHFAMIPLMWGPQEVSLSLRNRAEEWLRADSEIPRLLGASLLLTDGSRGEAAQRVLRDLSISSDARVKDLSDAQGWRLKLQNGQVPERLLVERWQQKVDEFPASLRWGPNFLLGQIYSRRHEHERAALAYLWLPLMDEHDAPLTARAMVEAAHALEALRRNDEANALYRELLQRFPDTPSADEARGKLAPRSSGAGK